MTLENGNVTRKRTQIAASLVAALGVFGGGTSLAWSAPALPSLQNDVCAPDCDVEGGKGFSEEESSWIGALMPAGAMGAGVAAGWLMGFCGRRWSMVVFSVPYFVGNVLYVVSYEVAEEDDGSVAKWLIYTGRLLTGFSGGAFFLIGSLFSVEVSEPGLRGQLCAFTMTFLTIGMVFVNGLSINDALHWNSISAVCLAVPVLTVIGIAFLHESPKYLISKGKEFEASQALKFYRGPTYDISDELDDLKLQDFEDKKTGRISPRALLSNRVYLQPFLLVLLLMFVQQAGGVNVVSFYVQIIFEDAGSDLDPGLSGFLVSFAMLCGNVVAVVLVERYGRRPLLVISTSIMGCSLFGLGTFFYIEENAGGDCHSLEDFKHGVCKEEDAKFDQETVDDLGWLPLVSMIVYMVGFALGMGCLPYTVNAEMYLPESRSLCASLAVSFNWLIAFLVTKFNSNLESAIGTGETYFCYATICIVGAIAILMLLPETKGKTPQELAQKFKRGYSKG